MTETVGLVLDEIKQKGNTPNRFSKKAFNKLMKAMLNVLQDEGFIVYNANPLLGFIYGVKDFDTSDSNIDIS